MWLGLLLLLTFFQVASFAAGQTNSRSVSSPTQLHGSATASDDGTCDGQDETAKEKLYQQLIRNRESIRYQIIAAEECEGLARRMAKEYPDRFVFHPTKWGKFPDGTDNIEIGGFSDSQNRNRNLLSGERVLFLASFHSNDTTLSQFMVMITLLQSFIESLTVVLPFSPVGTMERVTKEGQVATAATYAHSKSKYSMKLEAQLYILEQS